MKTLAVVRKQKKVYVSAPFLFIFPYIKSSMIYELVIQ
jgi:hypothetical protein